MRRALRALVVIAALAAVPAYAQTDFPNRRIHMVVPYPAGGIVDIVTRIVTDKLAEIWRQPIIIEAKPGASGNIAWDQVARAEPDGYTWTFVGPVARATRAAPCRWWRRGGGGGKRSLGRPGAVAWAPSVLVVHPSVPANT